MANMGLERFLVDFGLGPAEGSGFAVVSGDDGIERLAELFGRGEAGAIERGARVDGEPGLDLVEPARVVGREVDVGMAGEPAVVRRLVGVEITEDHMQLAAGIHGHDSVHDGQELAPPSAMVVPGYDPAGGAFEGGEEARGAMSGVGVAVADQRLPDGQPQIALRAFQGLDVRSASTRSVRSRWAIEN